MCNDFNDADFYNLENRCYECLLCNYKCSNKFNFNKHLGTAKHKKLQMNDAKSCHTDYRCDCGKNYKYRQGLHAHKKICSKINQNSNNLGNKLSNKDNDNYDDNDHVNIISKSQNNKNNSKKKNKVNIDDKYSITDVSKDNNGNLEKLVIKLITENNDIKNILLKENEELKKKLNEKDNQISELIPKLGNTTINNNQRFNINLFLNEKCKDAMTMKDFVKNIDITVKNLLTTKHKGIGIGINEIISENINKLSVYERPIHCTDKKREILYIKNDKWEKDIDKINTFGLLKELQMKQIKSLQLWIDEHPNYQIDQDENYEYMKLINKCTSSLNDHEKKIFRNICDNTYLKDENYVLIDK